VTRRRAARLALCATIVLGACNEVLGLEEGACGSCQEVFEACRDGWCLDDSLMVCPGTARAAFEALRGCVCEACHGECYGLCAGGESSPDCSSVCFEPHPPEQPETRCGAELEDCLDN
jgi:hypothetical protein